ncbi:MAG: hypothetical protein C7B44_11115 [Sulfobacillus thermosulfidooxidans]|uniref:hypothetical protein n=1 Tax=Sulfobacillus sp. hq2 TaxID=2039167 RepID=UPI000CD008A0|nr:hypothetical protein [Sulfobacillus sp. hq2]POB09856.1 hypothetical protein CO251_13230 [Sulfobacillus sp. hq2]PSR36038.1 MAG: hypothetical protein C7B44_11115 [Sulfobacillus thermosulfidooxidans]
MPWRERLRIGTGALWIISGLLMFQPLIRSPLFFTDVLAPVAEAWQPFVIRALLRTGDRLWLTAPHLWPLLIGVGEVLSGIGLLWHPTKWGWLTRLSAWILVLWSIVVWVMGEGFGSLFNGTGSVLDGTPGNALLYGICTALLLIPIDFWDSGQVAHRVRQAVGWIWIMMAGLQALPGAGFWHGSRLAELFGLVTMNGAEPAWLQQWINEGVMWSFHDPALVNLLLVIIMLGLGLAWLVNWRYAPLATTLWVLWIWMIPQAFGALMTHLAPTVGMIGPWLLLIGLARHDRKSLRQSSPAAKPTIA